MSQSSNDNLFRFFKSRLKASQKEEAWNTPPDSVFEGAMNELNKNKKSNRNRLILPFLILFGFLFLIITGNFVYQYINGLNTKVQTLEEYVIDLQQNTDNTKTTKVNPVATILEDKNSIDNNIPYKTAEEESIIRSITEKPVKSSELLKEESKSTNLKLKYQSALNEVIGKEAKSGIESDFVIAPETSLNGNYQDKLILPYESLAYLRSNIEQTSIVLFPDLIPVSSLSSIETANTSKYSLSILAGTHFSSLSMNNTPANYPELTGYDSYFSGLSIGANLGVDISNKFSFRFGSEYNKLNNQSNLVDQMIFNSENIILDSEGNEMYKTTVDIETPFGQFNTDVNFRADQAEGHDGDVIKNETKISQSLNILNFTVGVNYSILRSERINLYAGSGIGFETVLSSMNSMQTKVSMMDKNMAEFDLEMNGTEKLSRNYLSTFVGIGISYKTLSNVGFVLDTRFKRSLNSLRESKGNVEPKTYLQQFNLALGINYHF